MEPNPQKSVSSAFDFSQNCSFPPQPQAPNFQQRTNMGDHPILALRARSHEFRTTSTDATFLTPHTPPKAEVQMSTNPLETPLLSKSPRLSFRFPTSVPKAPRAMVQGQTSTPTKRISPEQRTTFSHVSDSPHEELILEAMEYKPSEVLSILKRPQVPLKKSGLAVIQIKGLAQSKKKITCWTCGQEGHDMMVCKDKCGHCEVKGHNSIACKYRTLPGGEHGRRVLNGGLGELSTAAIEKAEQTADLVTPKKEQRLARSKVDKEGLMKSKELRKQVVPGGPAPSIPGKRRGAIKPDNYERDCGLQKRITITSPHLGRGERRYRVRSYDQSRYCDSGGRKPDYTASQSRESRYHEMDYNPRRARAKRERLLLESPRTPYERRGGYIPEENGKWKRERGSREEFEDLEEREDRAMRRRGEMNPK